MTMITLTAGHRVHHVARRADHRARHRQRHLADHLRGHRRRPAVGASARPSSSCAQGEISRSSSCCRRSCVHGRRRRASIIFMERGQRRIPVQYAKRVVGRRMYGGQSAHLPLKVNTSGVIPPIFASSILIFPAHDRAASSEHPVAQLRRRAAARRAALRRTTLALRRADHLLLLLLHGGHLQPGRRRRQHEEVRRLHPGHPAGQADGRVHRPRPRRASRSAARSTSRPSASCRRSSFGSSTCRSTSAARRS